jgi:hypothetical protein
LQIVVEIHQKSLGQLNNYIQDVFTKEEAEAVAEAAR